VIGLDREVGGLAGGVPRGGHTTRLEVFGKNLSVLSSNLSSDKGCAVGRLQGADAPPLLFELPNCIFVKYQHGQYAPLAPF
jgi:hypothetical protein